MRPVLANTVEFAGRVHFSSPCLGQRRSVWSNRHGLFRHCLFCLSADAVMKSLFRQAKPALKCFPVQREKMVTPLG